MNTVFSTRRAFLFRAAAAAVAGAAGPFGQSAFAQRGGRADFRRRTPSPSPYPQPGASVNFLAETDPSAFSLCRVRYAPASHRGRWDDHPASDEVLMEFIARSTWLKPTARKWAERVVDLNNPEQVYSAPFLFINGESPFFLTPEQAATLGEFFKRGGFLYGDECTGATGRGRGMFFEAFQREIPKALPATAMQPVPVDHPIYRCFFEMRGPAPKPTRHMGPDMGLSYGDRLVAFLTPSDVHCAWAVEVYRQYREECLKMGANIVIYALTH